jgi:hypothetical protein
MSAPEFFEVAESHAVFKPFGHVSLQQAVQMVISALAYAREQNVRKLLANLTGLTGFPSPSAVARYQLAKDGAQAAAGAVRLAMVVSPEIFDPQKFGVLVGRHHGLISDVFLAEQEALAWLLG